jgi:hypothetical protein
MKSSQVMQCVNFTRVHMYPLVHPSIISGMGKKCNDGMQTVVNCYPRIVEIVVGDMMKPRRCCSSFLSC